MAFTCQLRKKKEKKKLAGSFYGSQGKSSFKLGTLTL